VDEQTLHSRLSRISTLWTLLEHARRGAPPEAEDPRLALIRRYQGAAYRYLLAAVRDPDAADDLFQEFVLRMLHGGFRSADPSRGRFRSYIKTVLFHLAADYRKKRGRARTRDLQAVPDQPAAAAADEADRQFADSWRDDLLARAWDALAEQERAGGPAYHGVLRYRAEHPEASTAEITAWLGDHLDPPRQLTEAAVRKMLQRARTQFASFLVEEVARSLGQCSLESVEEELRELGLLVYCRAEMARRRGGRG
jgi:RNA polymerase sigma factor (sigma-70 family)